MSKVIYQVIEHDGGWAYRVGDVISEPYATHEQAHEAAQRAAERQRHAGATDGIEYQDAAYHWHREVAAAGDRPETELDDPLPPPHQSGR